MGKVWERFGAFLDREDYSTYLVLNQPKASVAQKLDEFGIKFVIRVPGTSCEFHRGIEVGKHVDFAGWVLGGRVGSAQGHEVTGSREHLDGLDGFD